MIVTFFGNIALENIQGTLDSLGQGNYAFALLPSKSYESRFFNYIISTDETGAIIEDYVLEYAMAPEFEAPYRAGRVNLSSFTGYLRTYEADSFFDENRQTRNDDCMEPPIVSPIGSSGSCGENEFEDGNSDDTNGGPDDPVDGESGGGGSSDGTGPLGDDPSDGDSGQGGEVTCNTTVSVNECNGDGQHDGTFAGCTGSFKGSTVFFTTCSDGTSSIAVIALKTSRNSGCGPAGSVPIVGFPTKSWKQYLVLHPQKPQLLMMNVY